MNETKFTKKYAKIYKAYNYMQKRLTKIQNTKTDYKTSVQFSLSHTCLKYIFPKDLANTVICRPVGGLSNKKYQIREKERRRKNA